MRDKLNQAIEAYQAHWRALAKERADATFFAALKPEAVGWKVKTTEDFDRCFAELRDQCDQIHVARINDRWIAAMHLKDQPLNQNISVVKLLQLRPKSTDALGLDHLDFLLPAGVDAEAVLSQEPNLKWTHEHNGEHSKWLSIWFAGTEAKLRQGTVLDVCIAELEDVNRQIKGVVT